MNMQTPELHLRANASYQVSCEPWSGRAADAEASSCSPAVHRGQGMPSQRLLPHM